MPGVLPDFASPAFRRLGSVEWVIVSDPTRFRPVESEDLVIMRVRGRIVWLLDEPGVALTVKDLRSWGVGCGCGRPVDLGRGTVGVLLGHQLGEQPGDPNSVTWLDSAGHRWSVMAPERSFTNRSLIAFARAIRALQPFTCLPLFSQCA
jgi:hypothetical protein